MEIQLQELIDQIKKDGVESAQSEAAAIIDAAKAEAAKILADANAQADAILAASKAENARLVKSSEDAIRQAGRNLLISFRDSVARELNAIIGETTQTVYSAESLCDLVKNVVAAWAAKPEVEDVSLILNDADRQALEASMLAALKDRIGKGVMLKASDNFDGGFRIAVNDSGAYYDYSKDAVVEMLSNYLSPRVKELLKEAE